MSSATPRSADSAGCPARAVSAYRDRFAATPEVLARAPGRATLVGAHIDTSEGWVLPVAIERGTWVAAGAREDRRLELVAVDLAGESAALDLDRLPPPLAERQAPRCSWPDYAAGIAWALAAGDRRPVGMNATIAGDLPMGSGLSSSAALESALLLAWEELSGWRSTPLERARLGHRVESGYLGLESGIMDQFVVLHAAAGSAVFLDCRSLAHERIPLPAGARLVIADTGVRRRLIGSGFNSRREECRRAVELLREALPGLGTLRDLTARQLDAHGGLLPPPLGRRARHVVDECERARRAAAALRGGDLAELGRLMRLSHESSRDLYEVSLPELDVLAETAWRTPGCHGARFSGGGFGGCVAALVDGEAADRVGEAMATAFAQRFGRRPAVFVSRAADGAELVPVDRAEERRAADC